MLPDFRGLRQQSQDRDNLRSSERKSDNGFSHPQSSRQSSQKRGRTPKPKKKKRRKRTSEYIVESLNDFLALFPHRFDYIYSPHPDPGTKPNWQTESRHPLSDRLLLQGYYLYGLRPGPETTYALLDLDITSAYHPKRDPLALQRIKEALEPLGLVASLTLTSSDSEGLHVYLPCPEAVPSWQLGIAVTALLENKGFKVRPGQLEVFPNRKPYAADGNYSLFNAHRLPLQQGSYLLNDDLLPIPSSEEAFVRQWHHCAARNDLSKAVLKQTIKQAQRKAYKVTYKAEKFLNDLNAEIELGWTGRGQTNRILQRISMRSYIFGHILYAEQPLTGKALAEDIARVARSLPGFTEHCGHQRELDRRTKALARSIENSKYYQYASGKVKPAKQGPTENERRIAEAREHIRQVTLELCEKGKLAEQPTERFYQLCNYRISGETLYKYTDLWHPEHLSKAQQQLIDKAKALHLREGATCAEGAAAPSGDTSLLEPTARNERSSRASSASDAPKSEANGAIARNERSSKASSAAEAEQRGQTIERTPPPKQLSLNIQWALQIARSKQRAQSDANQQQYQAEKRQRSQAEHVAKLQQWVDSGDPILAGEAQRQLSRLAIAPQPNPQ